MMPATLTTIAGSMNTLSLLCYRSLITAILLLSFTAFRPSCNQNGRQLVHALLAGAFLFGPQVYLFYACAARVGTGLSVALFFIYPAMVMALRAFRLHRKPVFTDLALAVVAIMGVGFITIGPGVRTPPYVAAGGILCAAGLYAVYVMFAAEMANGADRVMAASAVMFGTAVGLGVLGLSTRQLVMPSTSADWLTLVLHSTVLGVGMLCYYAGVSVTGAHYAAMIDSAQPAIASMTGVVLLGEHLSTAQVIGIIFVALCVLAGTRSQSVS
ncbi:DMT family transporter [Mycolicibacterium septicum DSM 44393]|uniref:DMT family transporter n=1 Tax=Mycolicibacterium septicum DSM 44393 TaxID=1341646 RepID=A0A7X6MMW8_9MYCO|nr:DMT family transporter [Mycolicibacterium septicum DSM 44393]